MRWLNIVVDRHNAGTAGRARYHVSHLVYLWACDVLKLYAVVCMHHVLYEVLLAV